MTAQRPPKGKTSIWDPATRDWIRLHVELLQAELDIWRERHPISAPQIRENAAAKVEGRKPRRFPTVVIA